MTKVPSKKNTSWESVNRWYDQLVGDEGHYYHRSLILPGALRLLGLKPGSSLLDLACGQGVLARHIPQNVAYWGIDMAKPLVEAAQQRDKQKNHHYIVGNITEPLPIKRKDFSHAAIILALQNVEHPEKVFENVSTHLAEEGQFVIVINHPYFRIPRQSCWEVDTQNKLQYRRINRYMSPLKIPIQHHAGKSKAAETTWSFHFPLSAYIQWLQQSGFVIATLEEWCSDKISTGAHAKMENRSREEFPLFMALLATRKRAKDPYSRIESGSILQP